MALDDQPITPPENDFYMTDAFTDNAVKFLDEGGRREQPFFLYLAYTAPHYPLHARPEEIARYRGRYQKGWDALRRERHARQLEMGIVDAKWPLSPRDPAAPAWEDAKNRDEWDLRMSVYAAQVEAMDRGVGQVLQKIEALGETQNTLVMFLSDNGAVPKRPTSNRLLPSTLPARRLAPGNRGRPIAHRGPISATRLSAISSALPGKAASPRRSSLPGPAP